MSNLRLSTLILALTLFTSFRAVGQVDPGPCDTCWKNWSYDSTFTLGGHIVPYVDDAVDLYGFDVSQDYATDPNEVLEILNDATLRPRWIDSAGHPWGGFWVDSGAPAVGKSIYDVGRVNRGLRQRRFERAYERGYKLFVHPGEPHRIMKAAHVRDNYLVQPAAFQNFLVCEFPPQDTAGVPNTQTAPWRRQHLDSVTGGFYWTYTVADTVDPDTVMMAGRPDWVGSAFGIDPRADDVYRAVYGTPLPPEQEAKLKWLSVGFALWAHPDSITDDNIPDNAVIAYADLFVRDTAEQSTCKCRILKPWKRITFTKAEFFAAIAQGRAREAINDEGNIYYDLDTLIDFAPVWEIVAENFGNPTGGATCNDFCDSMLAARMALPATDPDHLPPGSYQAGFADDADFSYKFYTTRIVPIGFLRSRVARHAWHELNNGVYDSLITAAVTSLYVDPRIDSLIGRYGIGDEVGTTEHLAWNLLASKTQRAMAADSIGSQRPKQLWINPPHNPDAFRLFSGDFDSTAYRQVHMVARQRYLINPDDPLPIFYADIDTLGVRARDTLLRLREADEVNPSDQTDTIRHRMIVGNNASDYRYYRACTQGDFGSIRDFNTPRTASQGPHVPAVARIVDVMSTKYHDRFPNVPPAPVWNVVQTHGHMTNDQDRFNSQGYDAGWGDSRTPTPEEIAAMAWLSLNSGASGLIFGDFVYSGVAIGLSSQQFDEASGHSDLEYGMMRTTNQSAFPDTDRRFRVESMWLGFKSRHERIVGITRQMRHVDTLIGWTNLAYNGEQISVHDTTLSFDAVPMLEELRAERAKQYAVDTVAGRLQFSGAGTLDARAETWMEATHFRPTRALALTYGTGTRFLLITNRLTYPVDLKTYNSDSIAAFNDRVAWFSSSTVGLGAIDVRRPVVIFQNSTDVMADSLIVERLDSEEPWIDTVSFGDTVRLPWHLPGAGRLYRLTPYARGLSDLGTAYNNAVHSENPASDTLARDRLLVYERDSAVYLRTVDALGVWSGERLLSAPGDTAVVNGKRVAANFLPALATSRNNEGATRVVWERRDTSRRHSVESALLYENAIGRQNLDTLFFERQRLSAPRVLDGPLHLSPSIVGVHDTAGTGGFVVAWAGPDSGVTLLAIRELTVGGNLLGTQDTVAIRRIHSRIALPGLDSLGQYPTLAHAAHYGLMDAAAGITAGSTAEDFDPLVQVPEDLRWYNRLWLAYQQGDGQESAGEQIIAHPVGVIFPRQPQQGDPVAPGLLVGHDEWVTEGIDACSFVHPSIAVDSARLGTTFAIIESSQAQRTIGLRFRDTLTVTATPRNWQTPLYRWGGPLKQAGPFLVTGAIYERPSLTHMPSLDSMSLARTPEGGLVWFRRDGPGGRAFPQWLYRYGWFAPRDLGDGKHPTMTLVPYRTGTPFAATSIFHRGSDSSRIPGSNRLGRSVDRYRGRLLNTPGNPVEYFAELSGGSSIIAGATVLGFPPACNRARSMEVGLLFAHGNLTHPPDDRHAPGDPSPPTGVPGLPPTFFAPPGNGSTVIDTIAAVDRIARTSLFVAGNQTIGLRRVAGGGGGLRQWLDGYGWDSERNAPANVWTTMELVRAVDSVVLWRGDTLSARGLDTTTGVMDDLVSVPVDQVADSGTVVFVRLRGFATAGVPMGVHAGFRFSTVDSTDGGYQKVVRRDIGRDDEPSGGAVVDGARALQVHVVPSPARERAEVRIRVATAGRVRVSVWNMQGGRMATLGALEADTAGEYRVTISLAGVRPGVYLVRAANGETTAAARLTVVR